MQKEILVISIIIIIGFIIVIYLIKKWLGELSEKQKPSDELLEIIKMLQQGSKEDRKVLLDSLQKNTQALNERLDNAARIIGLVQRNIGEMSEIGRGMKELQEFLKSPKLRGNIGEQILKELLGQMLPKQSFHLQYTFKSGATVDAAIKTGNGIIPVDSKFPMENFRKLTSAKNDEEKKLLDREFEKDVKRHIDDISKKYILTEEGTIDYALMYIPSESVYYEVVNSSSLFDYSATKRVLPVSPMTFYAYLRAILMSFEGQKIEQQAKKILQTIRAVQKDYLKVEDNLSVLGRHVTNAYNQMSNVLSSFTLLGQKLSSTHTLEEGKKEEDKQLETS
ncbi:DNA recombination protein RmuC [Candidatus Gottesmanbacteria bacterium]|nr:DNA recombination protein RmuC [Candidatus Gottesmanbacteria bacterium]